MKIRHLISSVFLTAAILLALSCGYIVEEEEDEEIPTPFVPTVINGYIESYPVHQALTDTGHTVFRCWGITDINAVRFYNDDLEYPQPPANDKGVWGYYVLDTESDLHMREIDPQSHTLTLTIGTDTLTTEYQTDSNGYLLGGHDTWGGITMESHCVSYGDSLSVLYADETHLFCRLHYNRVADTLIYDLGAKQWSTIDGDLPTAERYKINTEAQVKYGSGILLYDPVCFSPDGTRLIYRRSDEFGKYAASWYIYDRTDETIMPLYDYSMEKVTVMSSTTEEAYWYDNDTAVLLPAVWTETYSDAILRVFCQWDGNVWQTTEYHPDTYDTANFEGAYLWETADDGTVTITSRLTDTTAKYTDLPRSIIPPIGEYRLVDFHNLYNHGYTIHDNTYRIPNENGSTDEILTYCNDTIFCVLRLNDGAGKSVHLAQFGLYDYRIEDAFRYDDGYLLNLINVTEKTWHLTYLPDTLFFENP